MSNSIKDLKDLLDTKGSTPSLVVEDLQSLRNYIIEMQNARGLNPLPNDTGQNRSGNDCLSYVHASPPSSPISIADLNDWQNTNVPAQTCSSHTYSNAYCSSRSSSCGSRTACACRNQAGGGGCDCNGRWLWCKCHGRSNCGGRTACACHGRTSCSCNDRCSCNTVNVFE